MRKRGSDASVLAVQRWFRESVTYEREPYTIDYEQAAAVADESLNTIVVARAGSGKTRTLVAKIVYLVARCGVRPEEIMAFVFNANAAKEINERLAKMRVNGAAVMEGAKIASTFHAFSRKVVYKVCKGEKKCGKILAGEKEAYVLGIVRKMLEESGWKRKVVAFIKGEGEVEFAGEQGKVVNGGVVLDEEEVERFAGMMAQFINRAQQKYLGGNVAVGDVAEEYLGEEVSDRERMFIELGVECFRRYHWYLLDARCGLGEFSEYGTDFNLIVSWASKLIASGRSEVVKLLERKKYILIDEYQDFSQLFLAAVMAIRSVAHDVRLFVVGDDWQAINRFAGSDVEYFKEFEKYFPGGRRLEITTNYRCDREVVRRARKFMAKGMGKVMVMNPREVPCELPVVKYDRRIGSGDLVYAEMARRMLHREPKRKTVRYVKAVVELMRREKRAQEIMILHRNNETNLEGMSLVDFMRGLNWGLSFVGAMTEEEFEAKVRVMTMHKSKGLEAETVIILEADEGVIPKTHPDTILYRMFGETEEVTLDDQKRLFYVAMTRAKKRLYIMSEGGGFVKYLGRGVERWGG